MPTNFSMEGIMRLLSEPQRFIPQQLEAGGKECKLSVPVPGFTPLSSFLEMCPTVSWVFVIECSY